MKMKGNYGSGSCSRGNGESQGTLVGKLMQYTADQVMVLEQLFGECAKPSHSQRLGMICENPVLSNLDSEKIKAWFQNHRCLEKQRKEALVFQSVNDKMAATKKLLLVANDFLQKELLQLVKENEYIRKLLQNVSATTIDTNYESAVNSYQYSSKAADNSEGFFLLSEETMREFSPIATQSALDWVLIPRMKVFNVFEGVKEIALRTCSDLFYYPINESFGADSVQLSFVKSAMPRAGSSPDVNHKLSPFRKAVAGANWIYQSSRFKLGCKWLRFNCQIQQSLLKQLCNHQECISCCSFKEIELDQISCVAGLESLTAVVPAILPQVINLYLVGGKEQGLFVHGYLSCK